ncbi:hypothetical protein YBT020_14360 [Bacillus thuringiensis serovar finitimus YBT-020]|nr:hypothetical protein YBT020_14360 [Bacillus thuringiensis serovar finitimus YBT-020]
MGVITEDEFNAKKKQNIICIVDQLKKALHRILLD